MYEAIKFTKKTQKESLDTNELKIYVKEKIQSDPIKYGGDNGNTHLVHEYFKDVHGITVPKYFDSKAGSLIRAKNKFLESHPEHDYRKKNKGKLTGAKCNPITDFLEDT